MKKYFLLFAILFIVSCSSVKFQEDYIVSSYPLFLDMNKFKNVRKIEMMKVNYVRKPYDTTRVDFFYNKRGKLILEKSKEKRVTIYISYDYDNRDNIKKETIYNSINNDTSFTKYYYDIKNNLSKWEKFNKEGELNHERTFSYDKKNNLSTIKHKKFGKNPKEWKELFSNNYKDLSVIIKVNDSLKNNYIKRHYDKSGLVLKSESYSKDTLRSILINTYDKQQNFIRQRVLKSNGELRFERLHKHTFDEKGNIIKIVSLENNRTTRITYYKNTY